MNRKVSGVSAKSRQPAIDPWEGVYSGAVGLFLALALLKLGHPVIVDDQVQAPASREELALGPWPVAFGYTMLLVVTGLGLRFWRWQPSAPLWWLAAPVIWLGCQFASALTTIDGPLTRAVVPHFVACVVVFFLGAFSFARVTRRRPFWIGLVGGGLIVFAVGWWQHFVGLEETRRFLYSLPNWQSLSPAFLQKVASNRIYSTLFYPNTLAGVVLLLLPILAVITWRSARTVSQAAGWIISGAVAVMGLGCLYWSGSKAGWLIALAQVLVIVCQGRAPRKWKVGVLIGVMSLGLAGFTLKYADYIGKGATSVSARFDYWRTAVLTIQESPMLGSGPGTFMIRHRDSKGTEAEMTRLAHNDYLQQASDSGLVGGIAYLTWIVGGVVLLYRNSSRDALQFSIWLGLLGVFAQGFVEFGLYIPAISWVTFFLLGWLSGDTNQIDNATKHS